MKLIVTIDVEEDSGPGWICPETPVFRGVIEGLRNRLQPLFHELGIRPTLLISPIVLHSQESVDVLGELEDVELGAHLHGEQIDPGAVRTLQGGPRKNWDMQWDYPSEAEQEKLEALTALFHKQCGFRPTSFRAGRYGASKSTGALLKQLGYEVDSSATPHVKWPTSHNDWIDFTRAPEQPYFIAEPGNVYGQGAFDFLEVPITILESDGKAENGKPRWFRPAYAKRETLMEIVRTVRQRNKAGVEQPLVMMFHNVEVIPDASPYTKTEDDVRAYLDDIRAALAYALDLGFESCTLTDYARNYRSALEHAKEVGREYEREIKETATLDVGIGMPFADVRHAIDRHGATHWHHNIYRNRNKRWDVLAINEWVGKNISNGTKILSAGCGAGFNLYWLARRGFTDLHGFDINEKVIGASAELKNRFGFDINLWIADMRKLDHEFEEEFGYIEAMNCMMYGQGAYESFLSAYVKALKPLGYMAFDVIDSSFNDMANNQWDTGDWQKPIQERRSSEYTIRYSQEEVVRMTSAYNLKLVDVFSAPKVMPPRKIYIFQKTAGEISS